jgi:hypothetical protein
MHPVCEDLEHNLWLCKPVFSKECLVLLRSSLVSEFRNVIAICIAIKEVHLSWNSH